MASDLKLNVASAWSMRFTLQIPKDKNMGDLMWGISDYMGVLVEDMELRVDGKILPRTGGIQEVGIADGDCVIVYNKTRKPGA